jgi:hypothetical protein
MTMLNLRRGEKKPENTEQHMPRAPNVPAPIPSARPYSPEALNFAQKIIDDQVEIDRLKNECDHWRSQALAGAEQIKRLEMNLERQTAEYDRKLETVVDHHEREFAKLTHQRQQDIDRLTDERDFFKLGYARTRERLHVAGKVILDTLEADKTEKAPAPPPINLNAIAQAIEAPQSQPAEPSHEQTP